jgi:hypothetical protein
MDATLNHYRKLFDYLIKIIRFLFHIAILLDLLAKAFLSSIGLKYTPAVIGLRLFFLTDSLEQLKQNNSSFN